jgi:hypothetical protein
MYSPVAEHGETERVRETWGVYGYSDRSGRGKRMGLWLALTSVRGYKMTMYSPVAEHGETERVRETLVPSRRRPVTTAKGEEEEVWGEERHRRGRR